MLMYYGRTEHYVLFMWAYMHAVLATLVFQVLQRSMGLRLVIMLYQKILFHAGNAGIAREETITCVSMSMKLILSLFKTLNTDLQVYPIRYTVSSSTHKVFEKKTIL